MASPEHVVKKVDPQLLNGGLQLAQYVFEHWKDSELHRRKLMCSRLAHDQQIDRVATASEYRLRHEETMSNVECEKITDAICKILLSEA